MVNSTGMRRGVPPPNAFPTPKAGTVKALGQDIK